MPGSFKETREGLRNIEAFNVNVISNTVLTKTNLHDMTRLMTFLSNEKISEIQLWNFFPMERTDTRDLVVNMKDFTKLLPEILSIAKRAGTGLVLKSFPECLSMGEPGFFDSLFPVTVLPDVFWRKFGESGFGTCIYRQREECKAWKCWGLSSAYIEKYGDERNLLKPITFS
jgi:MoaA/NifB/PqqE/SkfB family radical SAM enzyme